MELLRSSETYTVRRDSDILVIEYNHSVVIAGNSVLNGGIRTGMKAVFNHTLPWVKSDRQLPGGGLEKYLELTAERLGLQPGSCSGLVTAAKMKNAAMEILQYKDLEVMAIVTAGVEVNGGRAGDPASYYEKGGRFFDTPGTVNILLTISAGLPVYALVKCIITATEAKTAALQELMAPSLYSTGLATGTGTDGIIVVADPCSRLKLTDAGLHSKLGELIGKAVKEGVKKALALETGLTPERQMDVLARLKRFGIDVEYCRRRAMKSWPPFNREEFEGRLARASRHPELVALAAALIHMVDEIEWGLLPGAQAAAVARAVTGGITGSVVAEYPAGQQPGAAIIDLLVDTVNYAACNLNSGFTLQQGNYNEREW